jgi:hypothetical protein
MNKILLATFVVLTTCFSCEETCDERCFNDLPADQFTFKLLDAKSGENLYFGPSPLAHPDSVEILVRDVQYFDSNPFDKTLSTFVLSDTLFFFPEKRMDLPNIGEELDTLAFEFENLGVQGCCVEYQIIRVNYNGKDFYPDDKNQFTLLKK